MDLTDIKYKLEFDRITSRLKNFVYSDLGEELCDSMKFFSESGELEYELEKVSQMKELLNARGDVPLDGLKDIRRSISKAGIEGHYISPEEFLHILNFLRISRIIKKMISEDSRDFSEDFSVLKRITSDLFFDKILEHNIDITIDETGAVKDSASSNLRKIRRQIITQSGRLRKTLANVMEKISEKDYAREEIITQRDGRFVIPVKVENKRLVHGIIHSSSSTGATVFIEPTETIELNNEITELYFEEKREIESILRELASQLSKNIEPIKNNIRILAEIDFLQAKAKYSIETISSKPIISENHLNLINAYHPVLLQTHKRNEVVPLDICIGDEFNTMVISGPNAGGKTVVLKTVGLNQLMLQSGLHVPAAPESEFRLFDNIFVSIGDDQSLENDLSTFSSHLKYIKEIISKSDQKSLVLIDEIASGTDPVLGSALSASILEYLSENNCISIVTTHNSELKEFAYSTENIENGSLEFNVDNLSPNFKFSTGVPGQSFTFEIARKFDFPEVLLNNAGKYLSENESRLEDLLKELNETKQKFESLKSKYDIENTRLAGLTNIYDQKIKEFKKNEKELRYKAKLDAENIIKNANKLIEKTIKEIRENENSHKEIKKHFSEAAAELTKPDTKDAKEDTEEINKVISGELKINDPVQIKGTKSTGEIISISGNTVTISVNGLAIKTTIDELEKLEKPIKEKKEHSVNSFVEVNEGVINRSLDIRGKYTFEITDSLYRFIDESIRIGLKEISVIHGKGSGKLRDEVHNLLKTNKSVLSYRLGGLSEGDTGVTVIEI
ncbi:MAG TPA: endonuclease MutS2 [Ignavibacteria bacterium]|nr:endonuclease MutS2 [Ignavibacteria bacterium]